MPVQYEKQRVTLDADEPISVTVDASDLTGASAEPLKGIISRYGRPVVARAFADFQQTSLSELAVQLYQMGFTLVHCPTWPNGDGFPKSVVSDIVAQDLRDQLEELEGVETFLVIATSREYIAVANAMRRHDKRVVIVAEEAKVAKELRFCADEFAILPPSKAERPAPAPRAPRTTSRTIEPIRPERVSEPIKVERTPDLPRPERVQEPVRAERAPELPRMIERGPEPLRMAERGLETARPEKVPEPVRAEAQDQVRLPSDIEVLAEVRRIVTAEGICTPRRLARALCPVDRTPTGELRSRIANRIQSLVDSGKLLRERLVVGGTSVETILVGDDRNGRTASAPAADAAVPASPGEKSIQADQESIFVEPAGGDGAIQSELLPEEPIRTFQPDVPSPRVTPWSGRDLDAIVESVLRGPDMSGGVAALEMATASADEAVEPVAVSEAADTEVPAVAEVAAAAEAPKRTRSRRRAPAKKAPSEKLPVESEVPV
jgi:hypothetical protein